MYRSRALRILLAMLFVLGLMGEANAVTYTWKGIEFRQSFRTTALWKDSLDQSPADDATLDNLMSDASLGAEFRIENSNNQAAIKGRDTADGEIDATHMSIAVNAPFHCVFDSNDNTRGMFFADQYKQGPGVVNTYTFRNLYFQGSMGFWNVNTSEGELHLDGNIQVTGPAKFVTSAATGQVPYIDALVDASRVDTFDIIWNAEKPLISNQSNLHLTNGNNAFYGTWRLTTRLYADVDGALGDADVLVCGATDLGPDPNVTDIDGKNAGILVLESSGAISPTARIELTASTASCNPYAPVSNSGRVVVENGATVNVRKFIVDGTTMAAGTYTSASIPGRIDGNGSIVVADVNATAVMTMACEDTLGNAIAGDTGLMPRIGTKGYKPGYAARIRARHTMTIGGAGYTFAKWKVTGNDDYSTLEDTTVTMNTSKTVTAVYTKATGASAPVPANKAGYISVATDISWTPDPAATVQEIHFGDTTAVYGTSSTPIYTVNGSVNSLTNAQIVSKVGALRDVANYYWQVRSNVSGDAKPQWMFTTGSSKASTPTPADGATEQAVDMTLRWTSPDTGATGFNVYLGTSRSDVENGLVPPVYAPTTELAMAGLSRGVYYYWRVDTILPGKTTVGDVWSFRANAVKIYLDTTALTAKDEADNDIAGVTISLDDGGVAVFKFASFNYGLEYDVIVSGDNKLGIWSDSGMNFNGTLDVSAPLNDSQESGTAKAGGYIGGPPAMMIDFKNAGDPNHPLYQWGPVRSNAGAVRTTRVYWLRGSDMNQYRDQHPGDANFMPPMTDTVYGPGRPYAQFNYDNTVSQYPKPKLDNVFGSGGTYGGGGGNSSSTVTGDLGTPLVIHAPGSSAVAYAGISTENLPGIYGQKELYELWGGSGGSGGGQAVIWSTAWPASVPTIRSRGGAGGGGAVEFFTKGNLNIGPNAQILSNGGGTRTLFIPSENNSTYTGGAGSGGSIRLVATGDVTINGKVSADGGRGGNSTAEKPTQPAVGSGGGGGRVAIYKGGTLNSAGSVVTVAGGASGNYSGSTPEILAWLSGRNGTVYGMQAGEGIATMVTSAHYPIPADGARGIEVGTADLTWLPGLGSTTNTVCFGTTTSPGLVTSVAGGRACKSVSVPIVLNMKYYWRVDCDGVTGPLWTFRSTGYEARNPTPATGAIAVTPTSLQLRWEDGYPDPNNITKREVFFGTDQIAVANAGTSSPLKIATVTDKTSLVLNLPQLLTETAYYWRVDTYASVSPPYIDGLVWSFTTRPPICQGVFAGDFNEDCKVDFVDFARLAANWGKCNLPDPLDCD